MDNKIKIEKISKNNLYLKDENKLDNYIAQKRDESRKENPFQEMLNEEIDKLKDR